MAGSYNHCVTNKGNLRSNESLVQMIENLGDAYEAIEELFGMIWWLAAQSEQPRLIVGVEAANEIKAKVEWARQNYQEGLGISKAIHKLSPDNRRGDE